LFQILKTIQVDTSNTIKQSKTAAQSKWLLFILLCLIWGSSFVLMKLGMFAADGSPILSAWQVAAIRIFTSGLVLIPFFIKAWQQIPGKLKAIVLVSGWLGSFIPAILFCLAESKIDSALAGTLNAVTPLSTLFIGWALYQIPVPRQKAMGILVGLAGCVMLFLNKTGHSIEEPLYAGMVLAATICYGWNVHLLTQYLSGISALDIATMAFVGLVPFSFALLLFSGYFNLPLLQPAYFKATIAASVLGIMGTAFASIIFYRLVKLAGPLFASLVTYGIPFIAIGWGAIYGEKITALQIIALAIILAGVYIANREKN